MGTFPISAEMGNVPISVPRLELDLAIVGVGAPQQRDMPDALHKLGTGVLAHRLDHLVPAVAVRGTCRAAAQAACGRLVYQGAGGAMAVGRESMKQ